MSMMNITLTNTRDWVSEPDGRGTWGILSTCILTIILCCWTSVSPNLPAQPDGAFRKWRYKFDLAFITILGSEFLLMLALGQWSSARRSVHVSDNPPSSRFDVKANNSGFPRGWI